MSRQLAVIAGEISTGKSSILQLIDYCLGAKDYPDHDEIIANVRAAHLSIEVREAVTEPDPEPGTTEAGEQQSADSGESDEAPSAYKATRYIIERPIGSVSKMAWLIQGDLDETSELPPRGLSLDPADPDSLSQFLLSACGLGGLRVKTAPTQAESATSILSFRDVTPLWFLTNRRMDNADLVLENQPHKLVKLRQVVDYFFGVGDEESSAVAQQIEELRNEIRAADAGIKALRTFLADAGIGELAALDDEADRERVLLGEARAELTVASQRLTASTDFASQLRADFGRAAAVTRQTDAISGRVASGAARLDELARRRRMLQQLQQREHSLVQSRAALKQALARQRALEQTRLPRDEMITRLGERFSATLAALGYPKLENAYLQRNLVPVVRGKVYHRVGSSGAMTLVALAWQLTLFEEAVESGDGHPGFLLIDSPQKNLRRGSLAQPESEHADTDDGGAAGASDGGDDDVIAASSSTIVDRIYVHLSTWLREHPAAQIIMVDNEPPVRAADDVVVEYSADPDNPPYGLIEDEDGRKRPVVTDEVQA